MHETVEKLKTYSRMLWKYRWLAFLCAAGLCLLGWATIVIAPNRYEVEARIFLDTRSMLKPLLKGMAVDSTVTETTAEMMQHTIMARPNLEKVARIVGLDEKAKSPEQFDRLIDKMASKITISGGPQFDNLYYIKYENKNPLLARRVVDALLDLFVKTAVGASRLDTDATKRFLDEQIAVYEKKLEVSEANLKEFKEEHMGLMPNDGKTYFGRLESYQTQLQEARLQLQEHKNRRDAIKRQMNSFSLPILSASSDTNVANPYDVKIIELTQQLSELELKFTDKHPDVILTKRVLRQLKNQKRTGNGQGGQAILPFNPIYQGLKTTLNEEEARIAGLQARVLEYDRKYKELRAAVDTIPNVEADLVKLTRDYDVNQQQYQTLVERREFASISEGVENVDEIQFKIVDPPRVPLNPVGPNRVKWITVVFVLALLTGIGAAITMAQSRPTFYNSSCLKELVDIPILGAVSMTDIGHPKVARGFATLSYSLAATSLFAVYAGLIIMYQLHIGFVEKLAGFDYQQGIDTQNVVRTAAD